MRSTRLGALAVLVLALAVVATAGCGSDSDDADTPPPSAAETVAAKSIKTAQAAVDAKPNDPAALAALVRAHVRLAYVRDDGSVSTLGTQGKADMRRAAEAWERYLALDPPTPDVAVASLMARAFGEEALDEPVERIHALEIVTEHTKPPNPNLYAELAIAYFTEKRFREGDLATARALDLAPPNLRRDLRTSLRQFRSQARKTPGR